MDLKKIYHVSLVTVAVARVLVWGLPKIGISDPFMVEGFRWHHFHTGLVLLAVSFLLSKNIKKLGIGIGAGLAIDEITLPLYESGLRQFEYWTLYAIVPVAVALALLGFLARKQIKKETAED